jgi:lysine 2,3-aminomutase
MENNNSEQASVSAEEPPPRTSSISYILGIPEWKKILRNSAKSFRDFAKKFAVSEEEVRMVSCRYPMMVNSYYLSLVKEKNDPIYKQCIPSIEEISDDFGEEDPLHEEPENQARKNVPSLITHRYPDRILFRVSNRCAMYCRFCTRKRKVGHPEKQPTVFEFNKALKYIREHEEIRDVLLSGGDPLLLEDEVLDKVISSVYEIMKTRKNGIIRIGTRVPCVLPQRITPELCNILKKYPPIYLNVHFNHPHEITPESKKACNLLADSGIVLGCQTVLLKGINDNARVMKELMQGLVSMRVRPYYIYQADPVKGTNHFRTDVKKGLEIYKAIRGHTSGLCTPTFVIDAPHGGGKIPLMPDYVVGIDKDKVVLRNYEDKIYEYPQAQQAKDEGVDESKL